MFKVGKINVEKALLLAPMEDISDVSFRLVCKELGADVVYTEFVNSEGLVRGNARTHKKLQLHPEERPAGIQIYGSAEESMVNAAKIAEEENPDLIDINAGCWVKGVVGHGAGAGLLKDPEFLQRMVGNIVKSVKLPVTVKTRIGWDSQTITILDIAKRLEDAGIAALTVHCRPRSDGHSGDPDWSWIAKVKEVVSIPVALNGGVMTAEDAVRAFSETGADAVMIARGAIGNPWIFREARELLNGGVITELVDKEVKINACLKHLRLGIGIKGEQRSVLEHRKFYTGYLKGFWNVSQIRAKLMTINTYAEVEDLLLHYLEELKQHDTI